MSDDTTITDVTMTVTRKRDNSPGLSSHASVEVTRGDLYPSFSTSNVQEIQFVLQPYRYLTDDIIATLEKIHKTEQLSRGQFNQGHKTAMEEMLKGLKADRLYALSKNPIEELRKALEELNNSIDAKNAYSLCDIWQMLRSGGNKFISDLLAGLPSKHSILSTGTQKSWDEYFADVKDIKNLASDPKSLHEVYEKIQKYHLLQTISEQKATEPNENKASATLPIAKKS